MKRAALVVVASATNNLQDFLHRIVNILHWSPAHPPHRHHDRDHHCHRHHDHHHDHHHHCHDHNDHDHDHL